MIKTCDTGRRVACPPGAYARLASVQPASAQPRPALFLDRDGVLNEDSGYVHRIEDLVLRPGMAARIGQARRDGWETVVVTNQSGIGRGYYGWAEFEAFQAELGRLLLAQDPDSAISLVCACPFHEQALPPYDVPDHPWRKPNPGMLVFAAEALGLVLARSLMIGDAVSDEQAARRAGVAFEYA